MKHGGTLFPWTYLRLAQGVLLAYRIYRVHAQGFSCPPSLNACSTAWGDFQRFSLAGEVPMLAASPEKWIRLEVQSLPGQARRFHSSWASFQFMSTSLPAKALEDQSRFYPHRLLLLWTRISKIFAMTLNSSTTRFSIWSIFHWRRPTITYKPGPYRQQAQQLSHPQPGPHPRNRVDRLEPQLSQVE